MKQIVKNPTLERAAELRSENRAELVNLESFTKALNSKPPQEAIKSNKFQDGAKYVPIGFIENWLDELYFGLWSIENINWQVVANEICVSLDLRVFHPIAKVWLTRSGAGAALIRQNRGASLTNIDAKIKNAMVQDFPHAKAEAFKNAAKSLGKRFGRDLNRDYIEKYKARLSAAVEAQSFTIDDVKERLEAVTDAFALVELWDKNQHWQRYEEVRLLFDDKKRDLQDEQF